MEKQDAENGSTIAGAEFGLYAKEDIKAGGKVIVKADEQLCTAVTGEDGTAIFEKYKPLFPLSWSMELIFMISKYHH